MAYARISISGDDPAGRNLRVMLDDVDISRYLTDVKFVASAGDLNAVELTMLTEQVDIDAEVVATMVTQVVPDLASAIGIVADGLADDVELAEGDVTVDGQPVDGPLARLLAQAIRRAMG